MENESPLSKVSFETLQLKFFPVANVAAVSEISVASIFVLSVITNLLGLSKMKYNV